VRLRTLACAGGGLRGSDNGVVRAVNMCRGDAGIHSIQITIFYVRMKTIIITQ